MEEEDGIDYRHLDHIFARETPGSFLEGANIFQTKNCSMVVG